MFKIFSVVLIIGTSVLFSQTTNSTIDQVMISKEIRTNSNQIYIPVPQLSTTSTTKKNSKSPWLAFILSAMLPGAGQLYNGDYIKAIIQPTLFVGGALLAGSICFDCSSTDQSAAGIGIGLAALSYLWSIIDAPISASNKNENKTNLSHYLNGTNNAQMDLIVWPYQTKILNVRINF